MAPRNPNPSFWKERSVLVTGHTGFKGGWLCLLLEHLGARVSGYALPPETSPNLYEALNLAAHVDSTLGDIRDPAPLKHCLQRTTPEVIFHLAAQPLVLESYRDPVTTLDTNVVGLAQVLLAASELPGLRALVNVTTDKCYRNTESGQAYTEEDHLGGKDPYSASKACAELVTASFRHSFFELQGRAAGVATARAGNVIGGGDWAADRILPDAVRAFAAGRPLEVRNPDSVRPWQHVLEPLTGYLLLAENLFRAPRDFSRAWNFGPEEKECWSVGDVADAAVRAWGGNAQWVQQADTNAEKESRLLRLNCTRAHEEMDWWPRLTTEQAIAWTCHWHQARAGKADATEGSRQQINEYLEI